MYTMKTRIFSGKACRRCQGTTRYVANRRCVYCSRKEGAKYYVSTTDRKRTTNRLAHLIRSAIQRYESW